ncbi:MAG: hypothetical protein JWP85_1421 [Rhodoglobus sp.]|nr:hypothetical protein [Rhodoglobus sp.]
MTDDRYRDWDAAYVLGSLSSEDRRAYERHLATCPACSTAVAELAGLPGILGKIGRDEAVAVLGVPAHDPPEGPHQPDLVTRLAASARRRRSRSRMTAVAAALGIAALLATGGFLAGMALTPGTDVADRPSTAEPEADALTMDQVTPGVMTASLLLTEKLWGTRFDWNCTYGTAEWSEDTPATYAMVVIDESGIETTVATWDAAGEGAAGLVASSSVPTSEIRSVEIRWLDGGTTLVRSDL